MAVLALSLLTIGFFVSSQAAVLQRHEPRIVNGEDAQPGEIPFQVSLQYKASRRHFCGGSILNKYYVVTAAHCIASKSAFEVLVVAGSTDLKTPHSVHPVQKMFYHEKYDPFNSWKNDIALIRVRTPFVKSDLVAFASLPEPEDVVNAADVATVSGYGRISEGGPPSSRLQRVNIFIADADHCKNVYKRIYMNIHNTQLCANDPSTSRGSCKGDSGGPLTVNGKLVGLVSWAKACSLTTYPTVYTRISSYISWINEHMA